MTMVDPRVGYSRRPNENFAQHVADLRRRLSGLEATRTTLGAGSVSGTVLQTGAITSNLIAAGAVQAGSIQAGAISAAHIAANAIEAQHVSAGAITAGDIAANAITAGTIAAGAVTAGTVAAGAISTTELAAGSVTAAKISVTTLSAITTNMGSIAAGTITGGTVQTASSGARVVMDSAGLRGYALNGTTKVFEINAGSGTAEFTGVGILDPLSVVPGGALVNNSIPAAAFNVGTFSDNYLINWSAEGGSTSGWGLLEGTAALSAPTVADAPHGDYTFRIATGNGGHGHRAIPVRPGAKYSVRVRLKHSNGNGTHYVRMNERADYPTGDYVTLGLRTSYTDLASGVANSGITSWTTKEFVYTVPAGIYWVSPSVYNWATSTGTLDFDAYEMREQITANEIIAGGIKTNNIEAGAVTTNLLAAGAVTAQKISVQWGGANMLSHSSFEDTGLSLSQQGWELYNDSLSPAPVLDTTTDVTPVHGSRVARVTNGTDTEGYAGIYKTFAASPSVEAGKTYTLSCWYKASSGAYFRVYIDWLAAGGSWISAAAGDLVEGSSAEWKRATLTAVAPAGAVGLVAYAWAQNPTSGSVHYFDALQFEPGEIATAYNPRVGEILTGSVGNTQIAPDAITTDKILAGTIQAGDILGDTITGAQIVGTTLSAIYADLGSIVSGTITGGTVQTASSGSRVVLSSTGLDAYNASTNTVRLASSDGSLSIAGATPSHTTPLSGIWPNADFDTADVVNLASNPSGETAAKYSASSDWAITREVGGAIPSFAGSYRDKHAFDGTFSGDTNAGTYSGTYTLAASTTYVFSLYVWIPSNYNGSAPRITTDGSYAGATETQLVFANMSLRDQWQRISTRLAVAADTAGLVLLRVDTAPSSAGTGIFYSDAFQVEAASNAGAFTEGAVSGWTDAGVDLTFSRTTSVAQSGVGAMQFENPATATLADYENSAYTNLTGTFTAGSTYLFEFWARRGSWTTLEVVGSVFSTGTPTDKAEITQTILSSSAWTRVQLRWTPLATRTDVRFQVYLHSNINVASKSGQLDSFRVYDVTIPTSRQVRILDAVPSGGQLGAIYTWGWAGEGNSFASFEATPTSITNPSSARMGVIAGGAEQAVLTVKADDSLSTAKRGLVLDLINDAGNKESRVIYDASGASAFVQHALGNSPVKIETGSISFNFAGSNFTDTTIFHNLGRVPTYVGLTPNTAFVGGAALSFSSTEIGVRAFTTTGATSSASASFFWLAMG